MLTYKQVQKLKKMRAEGWGYRPIAAELGCNKNTVANWCKKLGLTENQRSQLIAEQKLKEKIDYYYSHPYDY